MAEDQQPSMPQGPAGMQRPGVPGAGNILDPEVRGQIRESLHPAVHDAMRQARGEPESKEETSSPSPPPPPTPAETTPRHRAGPFPHGDIDLSFIAANVPAEPVRPRRGRAGRRFYFLPETSSSVSAGDASAVPSAPTGPKPG